MYRCKLHFQVFSVSLISTDSVYRFLSICSISCTMMSELISLFSVCDAWGQRSITIFGTLCCTSLLYSMCSCLKFSIFLPLVTENLLKQNCMRGNIWLCWLSKFIMHRRHGSINNFSLTIELKLIVDGCNFFYINSQKMAASPPFLLAPAPHRNLHWD